MANTSDSGRALCPLPLPQPRAALRTTGSFKVSPTKSRFSTDADRSEDSFSFPVPAPDSQHTQASDIAKQHRVWGAYPAITDNSLLPNPQSTISRSATSEGPPFSPPPVPPPFPSSTSRKPWQALSATRCRGSRSCGGSFISNHALNTWDQVFFEATNADLTVCTDDGSQIHVHSMVLMASSPVFKFYLQKEVRKSRFPAIDIFGVPFHAVRCFLRYLYSSRCERSDMEECALHLVVLAHTYMVPALKQTCTVHFEQGLLNTDNVVDVLQVARLCDAPRLYLLCLKRTTSDFKAVVRTDGWRAMKHSDPALEQELIEAVIRASMRKQEKTTRLEEDQVYGQLHDAMEALTHICRDGCRSIGRSDKSLNRGSTNCSFPACKRLQSLVRHFADCKLKVAGGCVHCKRMWQLLELHSRMCTTSDSCKVPLCGHFKDVAKQQASQKVELRWKMLVQRVKLAKRVVDTLSVAAIAQQLERPPI